MTEQQTEDLYRALETVKIKGLASFAHIVAAMPKNLAGRSYTRWHNRLREVTEDVTRVLEVEGAKITFDGGFKRDVIVVEFGGMKASSTIGLYQALKNWKAGAEKRLGMT